jgi:hypothetical protein
MGCLSNLSLDGTAGIVDSSRHSSASGNFSQSNFGSKNDNDTEFCGKVEREFADGLTPAIRRTFTTAREHPL